MDDEQEDGDGDRGGTGFSGDSGEESGHKVDENSLKWGYCAMR